MLAWVRNQPLGRKIFGLVFCLLAAASIVAFAGRSALDSLYEEVQVLKSSEDAMFSSSRATSNLMAFARHVEFLPLELTPQQRSEQEAGAQEALARLTDRIRDLQATKDPETAADLAAISSTLARYEPIYREIAALSRAGDFKTAGDRAFEAAGLVDEMRLRFRSMEDRGTVTAKAAVDNVVATKDSGSLTMLVTTVLALLGGLTIAWFMVRQITLPIAALTQVMSRLADGDDEVVVSYDGRLDEIGMMQKAMLSLRKTVGEAFRLKQMVDDMPLNVMLADPNDGFKITYVNKTTVATMRTIEHLVSIKADNMIGQSVDVFHKNPAHQHRILKDPANLPWKAKIKLGPETMDLRIAPVRDRKGNYVGAMLNWTLITQQVKMTEDFESTVKAVVETVAAAANELEASAQAMSATAEETNRQSTVVAAAAEQASANVQTVASAAEELSSSIVEIGKQVEHSSRIAAKGVQEAQHTREVVDGLAQTAQKIGEVVDLINSIASQTNLLALNATIEAARAGDAGKGFAVVASEVKALAQQTQKATEEIGSQISAIQSASTGSVEAIRRITDVINQVNEIASTISAAVEEQGAATREIARNVEQAAQGTHEVSANISGVTRAASESGSAASQVASSSGELSQQSSLLSKQVDQFLQVMRAA